MEKKLAYLLPDGESIEEVSFRDDHLVLHAKDTLKIPGVHLFGYRKHRGHDAAIDPHYHRNCFEFHYLLQGNVSFVVDGKEYFLQEGDIFVTFPNEMHHSGDQVILRQLYWCQIEVADRILGLDASCSRILLNSLSRLQNRVIPVRSEMKVLFRDAFQNITSPSKEQQMFAGLQLASALYRLVEYDRILQKRTVSEEIRQALQFIEQNKNRNLSLEEVARHCHLSLSYFKSRFKRETGSTPSFYIQKTRIDRSKVLLAKGKSVTETAHELGFSSSDYFSTVFRRVTLMTPSEYIQKHKTP